MDGEETGQPLENPSFDMELNAEAGLYVYYRSLAWWEIYGPRLKIDTTLLDASSQWLERRQLLELLAWKNDRSRDLGGGLNSVRKEAPAKNTLIWRGLMVYHPGRQ